MCAALTRVRADCDWTYDSQPHGAQADALPSRLPSEQMPVLILVQAPPTVFLVPPAAQPSAAVLQGIHTCGPGQASVLILNDTLHNVPGCSPSLMDVVRSERGGGSFTLVRGSLTV